MTAVPTTAIHSSVTTTALTSHTTFCASCHQ